MNQMNYLNSRKRKYNNNNNDEDGSNKDNIIKRNKKDETKESIKEEDLLPIILLDFLKATNMDQGNKKKDKVQPKPKINKQDIKCINPSCNHKTEEQDDSTVKIYTNTTVGDIDELIELGNTFHCKKNKEFNGINLRILYNLIAPLTELKELVGMKTVKKGIVDQVLFYLQGFNKNKKCNKCIDCKNNLSCPKSHEDMLHTVITGPPGVGKTELGKILAKIYKQMGVLSKGHFTLVKRADLIAKYFGHTAIQTQKKIDECMGGVMFIDEAYALGHVEGRDSFAKECLDTLNQNLSENRDFLCIIAGYKEALDKCFFNVNEGLRRRFTFKYDIEGYDAEELRDIFMLKIKKENWNLDTKINVDKRCKLKKFFKRNQGNFPNFGGDIETLFLNAKIIHSKRMIFGSIDQRRYLTMEDIEGGYDIYLLNRKSNSDNYEPKSLWTE
jgi:hypothetical protein